MQVHVVGWWGQIVPVSVVGVCSQVDGCSDDGLYKSLWWFCAGKFVGVATKNCTSPCKDCVQTSRCVWLRQTVPVPVVGSCRQVDGCGDDRLYRSL